MNIFAGIAALNIVANCIRAVLLAKLRIGTSAETHKQLLEKTVVAPISFFDTTPIGRVLNRFSSDMIVIDEELTQTLSQVSSLFGQIIASIAAIAAVTKGIFLILLLPISVFYYFLQNFFRSGNSTLARLDSISRSPIYADFSQTLNGLW